MSLCNVKKKKLKWSSQHSYNCHSFNNTFNIQVFHLFPVCHLFHCFTTDHMEISDHPQSFKSMWILIWFLIWLKSYNVHQTYQNLSKVYMVWCPKGDTMCNKIIQHLIQYVICTAFHDSHIVVYASTVWSRPHCGQSLVQEILIMMSPTSLLFPARTTG